MSLYNDSGWVLPFTIDGVLCDRDQKIWGEKCQDALIRNVYGSIWPEIKRVALDFQKAVTTGDYRYLKGKTVIPGEKLAAFIKVGHEEYDHYRSIIDELYINDERALEDVFLKKVPEEVRKIVQNTKYEDMKLDWWVGGSIYFGDDQCSMKFDLVCHDIGGDRVCDYIPKITLIWLDLEKRKIISSGD